MPRVTRRRKRPVLAEINEVEAEDEDAPVENSTFSPRRTGPMVNIMRQIEQNETHHNKYIREMQKLYNQMDHEAFMYTFIVMLKSAMHCEEVNECANRALLFCAKFVASYDEENTHPIMLDTFKFLLTAISDVAHIRYRICEFVNSILTALGPDAALDDHICDGISSYMIERLRDANPSVRVQAISAIQRLQIPDNPDDIVVKAYQFHLSTDPSPRVRIATIRTMGRNFHTIPYIMERLWDIDEKVRKMAYLHMSSFPVKAYKVVQRLIFLEQGLNDRSELVRKAVTGIMLPQWLESYGRNYIQLISALKLDEAADEIDRFRKTTKLALKEMFQHQKPAELIANLPLQEEYEFDKCVPFGQLNMEVVIFWHSLIEYLQNEMADELDAIIPELSVFCSYVNSYCEIISKKDLDKFEALEFQNILFTLVEILYSYDLGDEVGRQKLKQLLGSLLKNFDPEEKTIIIIVRIAENLITDQTERMQYFIDSINDILDDRPNSNNVFFNKRSLIDPIVEQFSSDLKLKYSSLKVTILDLEEQETIFVSRKNYAKAQTISDTKIAHRQELIDLLKPYLAKNINESPDSDEKTLLTIFSQPKKITTEHILKCLMVAFHMVNSKKVLTLTPNVCELYNSFILRHVESMQICVRDWALKCGTAYSMLYDQLSKGVYYSLYTQFFKNHHYVIWTTSIDCIFELIDRYGLAHFDLDDKQTEKKKSGRQLYSQLLDVDETPPNSGAGVDLIFMMSHFFDTCNENSIIVALVAGFCRLILHGHIKNDDIMEKLLLKYFNLTTDSEINQKLGVFFDNLIQQKKQEYLLPALIPTITKILDSTIHEINPETVLNFVIDSTMPAFCSTGNSIHNTIAQSFLHEMLNDISKKDLIKILAKSLARLEVSKNDTELKGNLMECIEKLKEHNLDPKTVKYLNEFWGVLEGIAQANKEKGGTDDEQVSSDDEHTHDATVHRAENINNPTVENSVSETLVSVSNVERPSEIVQTDKGIPLPEILPQVQSPTETSVSTVNETDVTSPISKHSSVKENDAPQTTTSKRLRYLRRSMNLSNTGNRQTSKLKNLETTSKEKGNKKTGTGSGLNEYQNTDSKGNKADSPVSSTEKGISKTQGRKRKNVLPKTRQNDVSKSDLGTEQNAVGKEKERKTIRGKNERTQKSLTPSKIVALLDNSPEKESNKRNAKAKLAYTEENQPKDQDWEDEVIPNTPELTPQRQRGRPRGRFSAASNSQQASKTFTANTSSLRVGTKRRLTLASSSSSTHNASNDKNITPKTRQSVTFSEKNKTNETINTPLKSASQEARSSKSSKSSSKKLEIVAVRHITRSVSAENFQLHNVMTRKRLTLTPKKSLPQRLAVDFVVPPQTPNNRLTTDAPPSEEAKPSKTKSESVKNKAVGPSRAPRITSSLITRSSKRNTGWFSSKKKNLQK